MHSCNQYLVNMVDEAENIMRDSLYIKRNMLRWICIGSTGFCLNKVLLYGVIENMMDDFITYKLELVTQGFDFVWLGIILLGCHPRRNWPPYFTLSVNEMRSQEGRGNRADDPEYSPPPLLVGWILPEFLYSKQDKDHCDSIDTDEHVIFLNPVEYTVDQKDYSEPMLADEKIDPPTDEITPEVVHKGMLLGKKDKR